MANLTEVSQWESVIRQIENGEAATGGADGLANMQAKQLANRTKWLKDNLAPIVNAAFSGTLKHGNNDLAGAAIVAKSLNENGYIKYASGLIIQWGYALMNGNTAGVTANVTFNTSFSSVNNTVMLSEKTSNRKVEYWLSSNSTKTGFQITANNPNGTYINWLAIGL